jgi:hypothetical protein
MGEPACTACFVCIALKTIGKQLFRFPNLNFRRGWAGVREVGASSGGWSGRGLGWGGVACRPGMLSVAILVFAQVGLLTVFCVCDTSSAMAEQAQKKAKLERVSPFSSGSAKEGHVDKISDQVPDAVLDTCLRSDPKSEVVCETVSKDNMAMPSREIPMQAKNAAEHPLTMQECEDKYLQVFGRSVYDD